MSTTRTFTAGAASLNPDGSFTLGGDKFQGKAASVIGKFVINPNLATEINDSQEMKRTLEDIVHMATMYAINIAPVGYTGELVASINGRVEGSGVNRQGIIEVGSDHWMFVEYGTGVRGGASDQPEPGPPDGYNHGTIAGQQAQPFMRTTLWWLRNQIGA